MDDEVRASARAVPPRIEHGAAVANIPAMSWNSRKNPVHDLAVIFPRERGHVAVHRNRTSGFEFPMPEWFGHLHKRRSTMTKSLILGAAMALALGAGTAMAQEANE